MPDAARWPATRPGRRLLVTVCPRELGIVVLPVERGGRAERLNAAAIISRLGALVAARGLGECVRIREGCAGSCAGPGPNVSVEIFPPLRPGEPADHVAIGWKTYVYSLPSLDCLATILDENLDADRCREPLGAVRPARARRHDPPRRRDRRA